jgi:hypothetical protein
VARWTERGLGIGAVFSAVMNVGTLGADPSDAGRVPNRVCDLVSASRVQPVDLHQSLSVFTFQVFDDAG